MVKAATFYAVRAGKAPGIYNNWAECELQVKNYSGSQYKKFSTRDEAQEFISPGKPELPAVCPPRPSVFPIAVEIDESGPGMIVYTDGACKNNQGGSASKPASAGLGVYFGDGDQRNIAERVPGNQTNNRASLLALIRALEVIPPKEPIVILKTDSDYSIKCVTEWIDRWRNNGWQCIDGKPVLNVPLIRYLYALIQVRKTAGHQVVLAHVKGHAGIADNEAANQAHKAANRLANEGCAKPAIESERDWDALATGMKRSLSTPAITSPSAISPLECMMQQMQDMKLL